MDKITYTAGASLVALAGISPALSQVMPNEVQPLRAIIDQNGINLATGRPETVVGPAITIGGEDALTYSDVPVYPTWQPLGQATINFYTGKIIISFKNQSQEFAQSGSNWVSVKGDGSTLTYVNDGISNPYTYTDRYGNQYIFESIGRFSGSENPYYLTSSTAANGAKRDYTYFLGSADNGTPNPDIVPRLSYIDSNHGYRLTFLYDSDQMTNYSQVDAWLSLKTVTASSRGCVPAQCTPQARSIHFARQISGSSRTVAVTDANGNIWNYYYNYSTLNGIRNPGDSVNAVTIGYTGSQVSSVTTRDGTWGYNFSTTGNVTTATITDPLSKTKVYVIDKTISQPTSIKDENDKTTSYQYDAFGRNTRITFPEGNYTAYAYDGRGNNTVVTQYPKSGSNLAAISSSATFSTSCSNQKICNKPTKTADYNGNETSYTYGPAHGVVTEITYPTVAAGTPQVRYTYEALYSWYYRSTGGYQQAASPVYKLTAISSCANSLTCAGTSTESKTTIAYQQGSAAALSNISPISVTQGSGNNVLTAVTAYSYDSAGNVTEADGPLSGTADKVFYRYSPARQLVGIIEPDPDGSETLKRRARRYTYKADGQVENVEQGTVDGTDNASWTAFATLQKITTSYGANGQKSKDVLIAGGTTYSVSQYSYDQLGRLECIAQRMNSTTWNALPTSACSLAATGAAGPDRILRQTYDNVSRPLILQNAYGITTANGFPASLQRNEVNNAYTDNGVLASTSDGKNNRTTYVYDGFDRLIRTRYPSPAAPGNSSTTDYEQMTYDANGNVTNRRLRDGQNIGFTYDGLNRVTLKNLPGTEPDVSYSYDLLNRMTQIQRAADGVTLSYSYDALNRLLTEGQAFGTMSYLYDLAGRRTRVTWNDNFYVAYDWNLANEMTAVRENGATTGIGVLATYTYDNLGRRTNISRGNGANSSYTYNGGSQLTALTQDFTGTAGDQTLGFSYSAANQIVTRSVSNDSYAFGQQYNSSRSYTANGLNQYITAGSISPTYDARGNLIAAGTVTYGYDSENQLKTVNNGTTLHYDPIGRLHEYNSSTSRRFLYSGTQMVAEVSNPSGAIMRRYVPGANGDDPVVWYEGSGTSDRRWYHADERGSVIALSNASGTSIATNRYDEWGNPQNSNLGAFQYTGQIWLPEIGLYYYKARMYGPRMGRFMQTDPIGYADGMNIYAYVRNDPINLSDPLGLSAPCQAGVICVTAPRLTSAPGGGGGDTTVASTYEASSAPQAPNFLSDAPQNGDDIVVTGKRPARPSTTIPNIVITPGQLTRLPGVSLAGLAAPYDPKVPYCGAQGGASFPGGTWNRACYTHDVCYGTPGASKARCDAQLAADIYEQCSASDPGDPVCSGAAFIYYWAVRFGGGGPFERAQRGGQ